MELQTYFSPFLTVRCIKAHSLYYLESNFKVWNFLNKPTNIYYSLANLNNMPVFTFDITKRKEEMNLFTNNFLDYVIDVDIGFDFDSHDFTFNQCYNDTKRFKELLDKYKIPYSLRFSGSGFHINIEGKYMPSKSVGGINSMLDFYKQIAYEMSDLLNLPTLDKSIYDIRRIWKLPYSIDYKTDLVCLPLDDKEFENFNKDYCKPENVLKLKIRDRGLLTRPGNTDNVIKLIGDLID